MMQIISLARPTLLALVLAFGGLAAAQADDAMKPDAMKSDDMNGGAMKSGAMKNTKPMKGGAMMKSGAMKGDAMKKDDAMKSDAVTPKNRLLAGATTTVLGVGAETLKPRGGASRSAARRLCPLHQGGARGRAAYRVSE